MNTKQAVQDLLKKLPDNCTLDDLQYHLYVLQAVERGRGEIAAGKKLSHEEVKRELRALVEVKGQSGLRRLRGKVVWEGNLSETRTGGA